MYFHTFSKFKEISPGRNIFWDKLCQCWWKPHFIVIDSRSLFTWSNVIWYIWWIWQHISILGLKNPPSPNRTIFILFKGLTLVTDNMKINKLYFRWVYFILLVLKYSKKNKTLQLSHLLVFNFVTFMNHWWKLDNKCLVRHTQSSISSLVESYDVIFSLLLFIYVMGQQKRVCSSCCSFLHFILCIYTIHVILCSFEN